MSRKGENIYKRKDGRWEGRYVKAKDLEGKAVRGYVYAKSYREVKSKLLEAKAAALSGAASAVPPPSGEDRFAGVALEWFEATAAHVTVSTQNKYWNLLQSYILPRFGDQSVQSITHESIECCCNALLMHGGRKQAGLSPKTVSDTLSVLRAVLQYAGRKGLGPPISIPSFRMKKEPCEMRVLSRCEQKTLSQYLLAHPNACNLGILVCLFTGLRVGELCALRWEDVSFSDCTLHVRQTMQRVQERTGGPAKTRVIVTAPKSPCSVRTIPLPEGLLEILQGNLSARTGYFLTGCDQKYVEPRTMQNRFRKVLAEASIAPANFHTLRHTFATRCVELGFDVKSLSEILGHASVNITMNRYVHPSMELKKENMAKLSSFLTGR